MTYVPSALISSDNTKEDSKDVSSDPTTAFNNNMNTTEVERKETTNSYKGPVRFFQLNELNQFCNT